MAKKSMMKNSAPVVRSNSFFDTFHSLEEKIRERAFEIFEARDNRDGDSMSDWLQAQSEILTAIALNFEEQDDRYVVTGEVPDAFSPDEIEIDVSNGVLSVGGTHLEESTKTRGKTTRRSRSEINFMRRVSLPSDADVERINSSFKNGQLQLTVPKARM